MSDDLYGGDAEVLEISEDAVRAWVTAWREFGDVLDDLEDDAIKTSESGGMWGDLDSIQQLERIYRIHLGGEYSGGLAGRIAEFAEEARRMATSLESNARTLIDQDEVTADALGGHR